MTSLCTRTLVKATLIQDLINVCPVVCRKATEDDTIITQLSPQHYALTNPHPASTIQCFKDIASELDLTHAIHTLPNVTSIYGSALVKLPCGCKIMLPNLRLVIKNPIPCKEKFSVLPEIHVLIFNRWTILKNTSFSKAETIESELNSKDNFPNVSTIWDENWFVNESIRNYTFYKFKDFSSFNQHILEYHEIYLVYFLFVWMTILTIFMIKNWFKPVVKVATTYHALSQIPTVNGLDDKDLTHRINVLFLVIIVLDLIIVFGFIALLFLYFRRKWTRQGAGCVYVPDNIQQSDETYRPTRPLKKPVITALSPRSTSSLYAEPARELETFLKRESPAPHNT